MGGRGPRAQEHGETSLGYSGPWPAPEPQLALGRAPSGGPLMRLHRPDPVGPAQGAQSLTGGIPPEGSPSQAATTQHLAGVGAAGPS